MPADATIESDAADHDRVYDAYLEACLDGTAGDPAGFLEERGIRDAALLERLESLHALMAAAGPAPQRRDGLITGPTSVPFVRLGPYRLERQLGEGGMGAVYLAMHEGLKRRVALKVIRPEFRTSETTLRRFEREAQVIARLRHPSIVRVHDFGADQGVHYCVMEVLDGRPLSELLLEGIPERERVARWMLQIARALSSAHEAGVVHRDVKPSNVLINAEDRAVLLDFGVAHLMEVEGTRLTSTFAGSPSYAAPEQISPEFGDVDGRTDVYAAGATMYECLTGGLPFEGGTVQTVFRRVLTEDPIPPRRINPEIPAAYELVTLKALERRPADRYASGDALAEDLEALLEDTSVRARSPGPLRRLVKWARRRPIRAAVLGTALCAVLVLGAVLLQQRLQSARERRARAWDLMEQAQAQVERYGTLRIETAGAESQVSVYQAYLVSHYVTEEEDEKNEKLLRKVRARRRQREAIYYEVVELVKRAERLDPEVDGADDILATLHVEKLSEVREDRDPTTRALYEDIVRRHDRDGRLMAELFASGRVSVLVEPKGAEVFLFRLREQAEVAEDGDRRLVPVPFGDALLPVVPGTWALLVQRGAGGIEPGDLILSVAGHPIQGSVLAAQAQGEVRRGDRLVRLHTADAEHRVRSLWDVETYGSQAVRMIFERHGEPRAITLDGNTAQVVDPTALVNAGDVDVSVFHMGQVSSTRAPAGLRVRPTAAPRFLSDACRVGRSPMEGQALQPGAYEVLIRAEGREPVVVSLKVGPRAKMGIVGRLPRRQPVHAGFAFVPGRSVATWGDQVTSLDEGFWMMEREILCPEYLEFLNDPQTLREIRESERPIRFPRGPYDAHEGGEWPRTADGRFGIPPSWAGARPILGVSFEDAVAYTRWRSGREGRAFALPTHRQWITVCQNTVDKYYVFGNVFRPKWMKSCFARPKAWAEPVMRYPIDQSPHGVFDLAGSASEWLDDWYIEEQGLRRYASGNWGAGDAKAFQVWGGAGARPQDASYTQGFRLVLPRENGE